MSSWAISQFKRPEKATPVFQYRRAGEGQNRRYRPEKARQLQHRGPERARAVVRTEEAAGASEYCCRTRITAKRAAEPPRRLLPYLKALPYQGLPEGRYKRPNRPPRGAHRRRGALTAELKAGEGQVHNRPPRGPRGTH